MPESELEQVVLLPSEVATLEAGRKLAEAVITDRPNRLVIHLTGDLGAGKTTLVRGFLRGLGHEGRVPSPTYTLVEPYELADYSIYHVDLYRLAEAAEVQFLGLEDACDDHSLLLVEWPERAAGNIEEPDLSVALAIDGTGRSLTLRAENSAGAGVLAVSRISE